VDILEALKAKEKASQRLTHISIVAKKRAKEDSKISEKMRDVWNSQSSHAEGG